MKTHLSCKFFVSIFMVMWCVFFLRRITRNRAIKKQTMFDIKSTSNAVWWIKHPKKYQQRTTLCQDMTDLFCNISMHGYNKLIDAELLLYERLLWFCLHITNLAIVITVLTYTWELFVSQYFALNLHDPIYPIEYIPFPGISICSNNRISRQAATNFAKELSYQDPHNRSAEYFFQHIPYLNNLYYKFESGVNFDEYNRFQSFLDTFGTKQNETYSNIRKTLQMLTPTCSDFIMKCSLNGQVIDCFGKDAFQEDFTMYGPCCIFNAKNSYRKRNSTFRLRSAGMGLTVLLNSTHSDDLISLLNMDAYIVLIHNPDDFPDITSGNAIEVFPTNHVESFISITAKLIDSSKQLRSFASSYRKCYFDDETPYPDLLFYKTYSFSNCIMRCRIQSIAALCNCVPFFVTDKLMKKLRVPYCNLHHVACLRRYNFKWSNVLTRRIHIPGLEREVEEALFCPLCLPSCDATQYDISMMSLPTDLSVLPDNVRDDFELHVEDISVLRVYFSEATAKFYTRVVNNAWEEALSTVGNIVSIFLGFSMVAVFEILYYFFQYFYIAVKAFVSSSENNPKLLKKRKKFTTENKKLFILP